MAGKKLDLTALTSEVEATETVEASASTLINGFAEAAKTAVAEALAGSDADVTAAQGAIDATAARFTSSRTTLAAAILANTPQAPA